MAHLRIDPARRVSMSMFPLGRTASLVFLFSTGLAACEALADEGDPSNDACTSTSCPADSTCTVVGGNAFCDCNDGFVGSAGSSATRCYPAAVDNAVCEDTPSGIVCRCDEGFEQPRNTIGCTPIFYACEGLTCGENAVCRMYSAGAQCECAINDEGDGYTWAPFGIGAAYTGAVIEIDADTGARRIVAGFWPDEFGGTHHPEGMDMLTMTGLTHLPEVRNMVIGPDGETLFLWVQDHLSNAQILKLNRTTGAMELMWAEHLVFPQEARHNRPEHAQCWNGERISGRKFVQTNNRGFAMDADGNDLLNVVANSAANFISPVGIVRISADGSSCEWVRRTGAGQNNAYDDGPPSGSVGVGSDPIDVDCDGTPDTANGFLPRDEKFYAPVAPCNSGYFAGGNKGSGAAPQPGINFRALHWVKGKLWAFSNMNGDLYEIDTEYATGWRVRFLGTDLAEDWTVEDAARDVVWLADTASNNNMGAYHFDEDPANRWWQRVSPICGAMEGPFPCLRGPMSTYSTLHQPIVLDLATGFIIAQHGIGTVRIEPETGNTVTFSL
jgi:hypothetical protein